MKKTYFRLVIAVMASMLIFSCGGDDTDGMEQNLPVPNDVPPPVKITKLNFQMDRNPSLDRVFSFSPDENGRIEGRIYTYGLVNGKSCVQPVDIRHLIPTIESDAEMLYYNGKQLINGTTRIDFSRPVTIKAVAKNGQSREYVVDLSHFTGLPIIYLNTDSGKEVVSKDVYEGATIEILGCGDMPDTELQKITMHGRGNAAWSTFKKKLSYTLKFETRQNILGMPKHKKWVMVANYRDKTLLRNNVAWWISSHLSGIKYVPKFVDAEVVFNGVHRGVYQFTEQVRIDKNRININEMQITDTEGDDITGGYIIELDRGSNSDQWEWVMPNMHGSAHKLSIKIPKKDEMNQQQHDYIKAYVHNIDKMFGDPNQLEAVMTKYIDMPSWAAQWLVFEISGTPEPNGPSSWYTYKDKADDKWYCSPPWDFDYKSFMPPTANKWISKDAIYMPEMLKYPPFKQELLKQWGEIRDKLPELINYINEQREYLRIAAQANWHIHEQNLIDDNRRENSDEFIPSDEAIDRMIQYLRLKWEFIDNNIANL